MALENRQLNRGIPIPLYFQLKELILDEIKSGQYGQGDMIPTENELSDYFNISRTTVRQAVTELVNEGWLYREKSKGTFVSKPKINQDFIQKLESFNSQIVRSGMTPSTEILEFKKIKIPEYARTALNMEENEDAVYIHRRRFANQEPIVTVKTYLPYRKCGFLLEQDFNGESLYESLKAAGKEYQIYRVHRSIEADIANTEDSRLLEIKKGRAIQLFTSIGKNEEEIPLEYSVARYRGDRNRFDIDVFTEIPPDIS